MKRFSMLGLLIPITAFCGGLSASSTAEITYLLGYVSGSGCEFYRNGSWRNSLLAAEHLGAKYRYLADRNQIASAEDFIVKAATESSVSGRAYQVRCANAAALPSADFLNDELKRYRARPH